MEFKIPVPWGHIAGRSYGSWSGTPVLGLHSWQDNCASFEVIGPLLSKEIFFVVIDLPGHGQSSHYPPGIAYHRVDLPGVIKRVADHQRWKKFTLLGHGVGAELAILFTAAFTNMVNHLILIDAIKPCSSSFVNGAKELAAAIDEQVNFDLKYQQNKDHPPALDEGKEIEVIMQRSNGELTQATAKLMMNRNIVVQNGEKLHSQDLRLTVPDTIRFSHDQVMNLLEKVKGLHVLFIKPKESKIKEKEDDEVTKFAFQKFRRLCSEFKEVEVDGAHYSHVSHPDKFVEVIEDFLLDD